jgi:hypothetical protein
LTVRGGIIGLCKISGRLTADSPNHIGLVQERVPVGVPGSLAFCVPHITVRSSMNKIAGLSAFQRERARKQHRKQAGPLLDKALQFHNAGMA